MTSNTVRMVNDEARTRNERVITKPFHLVASAALLVTLAGCAEFAGLFKPPPPPLARGANPLVSGKELVNELRRTNYARFTCKPERETVVYGIAATEKEICVRYHGSDMNESSRGASSIPKITFQVKVDGKALPPLDVPIGIPSPLHQCTAPDSPDYTEWVFEGKACTKNEGALTAESKTLDLASSDGSVVYASFIFGPEAHGATK